MHDRAGEPTGLYGVAAAHADRLVRVVLEQQLDPARAACVEAWAKAPGMRS
jgi:hypothetical protein